eukprot:scaffold20109_cov49-Prasinocladus_malaysianus.AAC.2
MLDLPSEWQPPTPCRLGGWVSGVCASVVTTTTNTSRVGIRDSARRFRRIRSASLAIRPAGRIRHCNGTGLQYEYE